jgi:hypothetical protein
LLVSVFFLLCFFDAVHFTRLFFFLSKFFITQTEWGDSIATVKTVEQLFECLNVSCETIYCEVVDLNDWVVPLNILDSALEEILRTHGNSIILIWDRGGPPKKRLAPVGSKQIMTSITEVMFP